MLCDFGVMVDMLDMLGNFHWEYGITVETEI